MTITISSKRMGVMVERPSSGINIQMQVAALLSEYTGNQLIIKSHSCGSLTAVLSKGDVILEQFNFDITYVDNLNAH